MRERSGSFGPVVGTGLAAGVLAAVASTRPWMEPVPRDGTSTPVAEVLVDGGQMPLATTLAMVVLAAWGVVLVTRGRWRVTVALLGAVAAVGVLATVVSGWWLVPRTLRDSARDLGAGGVETDVHPWFWVALASAVVSAAATFVAIRGVRQWPEMSTRYDAPTGRPAEASAPGATAAAEPDAASDLDLWKAMDQGRDPTA